MLPRVAVIRCRFGGFGVRGAEGRRARTAALIGEVPRAVKWYTIRGNITRIARLPKRRAIRRQATDACPEIEICADAGALVAS